jgi:hypothetical protein
MYNIVAKVIEANSGKIKWLKYHNVKHLNSIVLYIEKKGFTIDYLNVYNAKNKEKVWGANRKQLETSSLEL